MTSLGRISFIRRNAALMLILIAAAILRIYGLWSWQPTMDEVQFLIISQGESFAEIARRAQAEVHPPLAWFIRHFLLMISTDIFVQRLFSVAMGLGTIIGAYALGKVVLRTRKAALIVAFIMAFTPSFVIATIGLRNYPFMMLFMVWALVFFTRWQKKGSVSNLLLYTLFIALACASHFSAFLIAAACGLTQGMRFLLARRWRMLAIFSLSYLPLALLALWFYVHYLAPGTTIPMWREFMKVTGFAPPDPETGIVAQLIIPVLAYFSPFLQAVHREGFISLNLLPIAQLLVLAGGVLFFALTIAGLYRLLKVAPASFDLIIMLWLIALGLSVADLYPFSANRHNIYFLPFFIIPLAAFLAPLLPLRRLTLTVAVLLAVAVNEAVIWQDEDFCLTHENFEAGQNYLHGKLVPGDAIVTGPMGAYFYLIYAYSHGRLPYNNYTDKDYVNGTTLLAPFASPYKPYSNWRPFRDELAKRVQQGVARDGSFWFVQYGWKSGEVWTLMQCDAAKPYIRDFMSRDGIAIFSIKTSGLADLLENTRAWEACYAGYTPLVVGTPFKQVMRTQ